MRSNPNRKPATRMPLAVAACCAVGALTVLGGAALPADTGVPHYDPAGRLSPPADYRTWIFLSSGVDMSYSKAPSMPSGHMFDNVFVPQAAYSAFLKTGTWPDGTVLMLENRGGTSHGSINKLGVFQNGEVMGLEAHVKDTARFKGGWGFFAFDGEKPAERIPYTESCYACHQAHAAVDTTFVQFYPTLLPIATQHTTLSRAYLADIPANPAK